MADYIREDWEEDEELDGPGVNLSAMPVAEIVYLAARDAFEDFLRDNWDSLLDAVRDGAREAVTEEAEQIQEHLRKLFEVFRAN